MKKPKYNPLANTDKEKIDYERAMRRGEKRQEARRIQEIRENAVTYQPCSKCDGKGCYKCKR